MDYELELTRANRLRIAAAFRHNKRTDYSIDCAIEAQMGRAFVDDPAHPTAYRIVTGPFWYLAGDAHSPGGRRMIAGLPRYCFLMPSSPGWLEAAQEIFGGGLLPFTRFRFDTAGLSVPHLEGLLQESRYGDCLVPLDLGLAARLAGLPQSCLELSDYDSPEDFVERGFGFAAVGGSQVLGVAYSSLVCSRGIEVSIYVEEPFRRQGVATGLGSRLVLECLRRDLRPNWDAANPESYRLAKKLGFSFVEPYDAYYHEGRAAVI